jgi:hypothetical protein
MSTEQQEHLRVEQLQQHSADELEHIEGREREALEGWIPGLASENEVREALEKAFDYRGDVTLTKKDGEKVEGFIYDRKPGKTLTESAVRVILNNQARGVLVKVTVPYSEIAAIAFSGKDTAAGKQFELWVKMYWEKKAAGEKNIQIEPEKLD